MGKMLTPHFRRLSQMLGHIKNTIRDFRCWILRQKARNQGTLDITDSTLIIAPHPDDETIGCGGLITHLITSGNPPYVAILTGGGGSLHNHSDITEETVIEARRKLTLDSACELGLPAANIHFLDFKDGSISARPKTEMERLRSLIAELKPANILVPHSGEGWPDHLAAREIGISLASANTNVWEYCVWMWYYNVWNLDWHNARKLHLSPAEHKAKLRAVHAYVTPKAPCGAPWSGVLPAPFIRANTTRTELYFHLNNDC